MFLFLFLALFFTSLMQASQPQTETGLSHSKRSAFVAPKPMTSAAAASLAKPAAPVMSRQIIDKLKPDNSPKNEPSLKPASQFHESNSGSKHGDHADHHDPHSGRSGISQPQALPLVEHDSGKKSAKKGSKGPEHYE